MNEVAADVLMHYGMPRRSGRYPWGSGENPYQHSADFLARAEELEREYKKAGKTQTDVARAMGLTTSQYRTQKSLAKAERRRDQVATAKGLQEKGYNVSEIARKMGFANESSVRSLLNENTADNMNKAMKTAEFLKGAVDKVGMIDVTSGVETELGVSREKLRDALSIMEHEGYVTYNARMPQVTNPGKYTTMKVLCPPDTEYKEVYQFDKVHSLFDYDQKMTPDGNKRKAFEYPASLDSKRVQVRYAEEGGDKKDGVIELRRGVDDISLGNSNYAQVRILVDGTHYLKGMAVYADDLPDGIDVRFNTNKHVGTPPLGEGDNTVLKHISSDPTNPFKSLIKEHGGQRYYDDPNGKYIDPDTGKRQSLSVINKRSDEGDWDEWANTLSSQFLGKQNLKLIKQQLSLTKSESAAELDAINSLTNPTVKRKLLQDFADECDSAAVHLKAASLPRQRYQVILPLVGIKEDQIYAPNYKDGEKVALIRYPHGGTFEIPILTVNNKSREGRATITPNAKDAVGISKSVADRLSGADFDGDTVMVIPTGGKINITNRSPLKGLEGFDTKDAYGPNSEGSKGRNYPRMTEAHKQIQMGIVSNLITDMTQKGANEDELACAVKHSMVVIDAPKHNLDYRRSYEENRIAALKKKYQGHYDENGNYKEGVSTIISAAKNEQDVPKRKGSPYINSKEHASDYHPYDPSRPEGALIYKTDSDNLYYTNKQGKQAMRTQKSTRMAETDDAMSLVSDWRTPAELAYADYANYMKSLANTARKTLLNTPTLKQNSSAKKTYLQEVNELQAQLNEAVKNAPRERQAQRIANINVEAKLQADPNLKNDKASFKKTKQIALTQAREQVGAHRNEIQISDRQWEAIQSGAISDHKLTEILKYANADRVRELATPRSSKSSLSNAQIALISRLSNSGYTNEEIANRLGISSSTVVKYLKGK